jgi:hypothetical protein
VVPGYEALLPWLSGIIAANQTSVSSSFLHLSKILFILQDWSFYLLIQLNLSVLPKLEKYLSFLIAIKINCSYALHMNDVEVGTMIQVLPVLLGDGQLSLVTLSSLMVNLGPCNRISGLEGGTTSCIQDTCFNIWHLLRA